MSDTEFSAGEKSITAAAIREVRQNENRYHYAMNAVDELAANSARLLALARALDHDNAALRGKLAHAEAKSASLEKRLAAARARIEALIERLPENGSLLDGQ